jgi:hypothetical protein
MFETTVIEVWGVVGGTALLVGAVAIGYHRVTAESIARANIASTRPGDAALHLLMASVSLLSAARFGTPIN